MVELIQEVKQGDAKHTESIRMSAPALTEHFFLNTESFTDREYCKRLSEF